MNRQKIAALVSVLGILVAAGVLLATQHEWPFSNSPASAGSQSLFALNGERIRAASEIWSGEVSLFLNQHYALNKKPVKALESCGGCLTLESVRGGGLSLHAENGVLVWPKQGRPSYLDCVHLRESGTLDSVSLKTSSHGGGVPVSGWLCATGGIDDDILRMQYMGPGNGPNEYRFAVSAWLRPFVN